MDRARSQDIYSDLKQFIRFKEANGQIPVENREHVLMRGTSNVRLRAKYGKTCLNATLKYFLFCVEILHNSISSNNARRYGYRTVIDTKGILSTVSSTSGDVDLKAYENFNGLYIP